MLPHPESRFVQSRTLFVEARFRGRVVGARLLCAGDARAFMVGAARRADAPVDPAFLPADAPANDNHALVAPSGAGFVVNLSAAMRARVESDSRGLRVPCGEVVFDISETSPAAEVPRPWLGRAWRTEARYLGGVAAALLVALAINSYTVPPDPHALSLDDVGRTVRLDDFHIVPPVVVAPPVTGGVASSPSASSPSEGARAGAAGDPRAPHVDARRARAHADVPTDAASAAARAQSAGVLGILATNRSLAVERVFAGGAALGENAIDIVGHVVGTTIDGAYGHGGLTQLGTGAGGADTGHGLLGRDPWGRGLPGIGPRGQGPGFDRRANALAGLHDRGTRPIELIPGELRVTRGLDKEIVRRVVRRHLNEVRFCYTEALAQKPSLAGRVVVQFTIAATGRVAASALASSTLAAPTVERCIVEATRRWEYPSLEGAPLVVVSYPFQLMPAGS